MAPFLPVLPVSPISTYAHRCNEEDDGKVERLIRSLRGATCHLCRDRVPIDIPPRDAVKLVRRRCNALAPSGH